ncbi:MAG: fatty acid desaturase [Caldilineaceae bacterium]|nr:fatty acid desaturase [Caldilineaceae bacterium]
MQSTSPSQPVSTPSAAPQPAAPSISTWKNLVAQYQEADVRTSIWQIINSFGGYFLLWIVMYFSLQVGYWLTLLLAIPAGGFLVRIFIIQHDCGHGSFFSSRRANDTMGTICGVFTLVAYRYWRKGHALHHAHTADLGERGDGDIWTLTVQEYLAAPWWKRAAYRGFRNPFFLFVIAPPIQFIILHRFPMAADKKYRANEKHAVWWNNLAILVVVTLVSLLIGFKAFLMIQLPVIMIAASAGTWLFYVQHQFEDTYWEYKPAWDYTMAAMQGSSYYHLPKVLQWFTGNIGFHHIHHLSPRIPNYKLEQCHKDNPQFQQVVELTLMTSIKTTFLTLWDEEERRLISFRDLQRMRHAGAFS